MQCLSLPLATFKVFSLCLVFSSLTWYVSMASLVFTVLGVSWPPQVCEFSSNLEIFQLLSSNIFLLQSLFSFWALFTQTFYHSIVAHGSLRLVHFFSSLHFSSLKFSSAVYNLLLNLFSEFLFQILNISVLDFSFDNYLDFHFCWDSLPAHMDHAHLFLYTLENIYQR